MKIVALGDSLTVGETGLADEAVDPYPKCLATLAEDYSHNLGLSAKIEVLNRGINGDLTSGMLERFPRDVADYEPDYVIVLGGSNDVGWGLGLETIADNLAQIYDAARDNGIGAVACSVPSILGCDELIPPRLRLNEIIRKEAASRKLPLLDFFKATADQRSNGLREDYSGDGLHLNSEGYKALARCVFDTWLKSELSQVYRDTKSR